MFQPKWSMHIINATRYHNYHEKLIVNIQMVFFDVLAVWCIKPLEN